MTENLMTHGIRRFVTFADAQPRLSLEQELDLGRKFRSGDAGAGKELVQSNMRYAFGFALSTITSRLSLEDKLSAACEGLVRALQTYDPEQNVMFFSYAKCWCQAKVYDEELRSLSLVRRGNTVRGDRYFWACREYARLQAVNGSVSSQEMEEACSKRFGLDKPAQVWATIQNANAGDRHGAEEPTHLVEHVRNQEQMLDRARVEHGLRSVIDRVSLNARERSILHDHLMTDDPVSLAELGRRHKLTRERMRQSKEALLGKLRAVVLEAGITA